MLLISTGGGAAENADVTVETVNAAIVSRDGQQLRVVFAKEEQPALLLKPAQGVWNWSATSKLIIPVDNPSDDPVALMLHIESAEIWSRELVLLDSPLVGIIDPDFEILDPSFIPGMIAAFANDAKLAIFATEYSQTQKMYDTYSQQMCLSMERWHTWFCTKAALEQNHDFSFKALRDETSGLPMYYDSSAWLQKTLVENGWRGRDIEHEWWKYIHYGRAYPDHGISRDLALAHFQAVVAATDLPGTPISRAALRTIRRALRKACGSPSRLASPGYRSRTRPATRRSRSTISTTQWRAYARRASAPEVDGH